MTKLFLSRFVLRAAARLRVACIAGLFLTLVIVPSTSHAQDDEPDKPITTTRVIANVAKQVVPSKSIVRGRVVYDDTNRPVRRTRVMLFELSRSGGEIGGITNASGDFQIKDVPAGTYVMMVDAAGVMTPLSLVPQDDKSGTLNVEEIKKYFDEIVVDGNRDVTVKVRAKRGGAISGKVSYADGDPAPNTRVTIMRKKNGQFLRFVTNLSAASLFGHQTDDRGMYRITGLPPGDYVVSVSEAIEHDAGKSGSRADYMEMFGGNSLLVTYYKNATKSNDATTVRIDQGQEQNEINITIVDRVLHVISGTVVTRSDGTPVTGARITVQSKDTAGSNMMYITPAMVVTDPQGVFAFNDLPDGDYTLLVDPPYVSTGDTDDEGDSSPDPPPSTVSTPGSKLAQKEQDITVSGTDINDLVIKLTAGVRVSGIVTVVNGDAIPQNTIVHLQSAGYDSDGEEGRVGTDGRFSLDSVPPGLFFASVVMDVESDFYVKEITVNDLDLMGEPLVVVEDANLDDMKVVVSGDGATLSGRVLSQDNTPVTGAQFVLIPSDQRRWRARASFLFGGSEQGGSYSVTGAPGDYLIIFLRDLDQPHQINESWIRDRSTTARRVSLMPSERKNMDLIMTR